MKWNVCLLLVMFISITECTRERILREPDSVPPYHGCKKEDTICPTRPKTYCRLKNFQFQCPRKCGLCAPFSPKCPEKYKFGCCWDGTEALDAAKTTCPKCVDLSRNICKRKFLKQECDFDRSTPLTRRLCPETCGACEDYGNGKANSPPCRDYDHRCILMEDTSCCQSSEILRDLCRRTCRVC